jgi:glycine betaine/choline ABC-type transport system substrate-binding protein
MRRRLLATLALLVCVVGCAREPVVVGSKTNQENRIAAELCARILENAGLRVERRFGLGDSPETFSALRTGVIDMYPEYTGTALGLLGARREVDATQALERARAGFAPLGLRFLEPLGYESTYVVVVGRELASREGLETVSDLADLAPQLRLGVTQAFADRPSDGLQPFLDRFGLAFDEVIVLADVERTLLYDRLLDGQLDAVVGFSTDPEQGDYGLVALAPDRSFFPAYDAVPLVSEAALEREPRIESALSKLAGRLDADLMIELVRQVQVFGRAPDVVSYEALAELGLARETRSLELPAFAIAVDPEAVGSTKSARVLRAVREAVLGREVELVTASDPGAAVAEQRARVAHVPSISLIEFSEDDIVRAEALEVVAVTGTTYLYALARTDGPHALSEAESIACGPPGSASSKLALVAARAVGPALDVLELSDSSAEAAAQAVRDGRAEVALVVGPRNHPGIERTVGEDASLRLVDAQAWWRGSQRLALPFLREAVVAVDTGSASARSAESVSVETVAMQTVLTGPTAPTGRVIGIMGPATFVDAPRPLAPRTVRAINAALGPTPDVNPHLRASRVLEPRPATAEKRVLGQRGEALLTVLILAFLGWSGWLFVRRPDAGSPRP